MEADETYYGKVDEANIRTKTTTGRAYTQVGRSGPSNKRAILSLIERGGKACSFHLAQANQINVQALVRENIV